MPDCLREQRPSRPLQRMPAHIVIVTGLAGGESDSQLPSPILPIRAYMSVATRKVLVPSLAASLVLVTPAVTRAQTSSVRPASVALTVVVPQRATNHLTSVDAIVLRRTDSMLDVETVVGIANRPASRIEIRLGAGWSARFARVLVQNRSGEFEALTADAGIAAAVVPGGGGDTHSRLKLRIESEQPMETAISVPVEYRVTIGEGDQVAVWAFPARLEIGKR